MKRLLDWLNKISSVNTSGIPFPMVMDPITGKGSITCTLVAISAFFVMLGIYNVPKIDKSMAIDWFLYCLGGYLGRTLIKKGKDSMEVGAQSSNAPAKPSNSDEESQ